MLGACLLVALEPVLAEEPPVSRDAPSCGPSTVSGKLNVSVDPRIELLSIVQLLSGYVAGASLINTDATVYRRDLDLHFARHRGHSAVAMFSQMYPQGFAFHAPPQAMLHFSEPPALKPIRPVPANIVQAAGGQERFDAFMAALRDFARETRFMAFYRAHSPAYKLMVSGMCAKTGSMDLVGGLERYFGVVEHSYNIMLMPLTVELGFAAHIERNDGKRDLYQMIGRSSVRDASPVFGQGGTFSLQTIMWHEFGHSFVNPLTEKHRDQVAHYESLYAPIAPAMKAQAYPTWEISVNEHIVRAVTARLVALHVGEDIAARRLQADKQKGFLYIEPLAERLKEYEAQRERYPTFSAFYPRLLEVLQKEFDKTSSK